MFDIGPNARKKLLQPSGSLFIGHCDSNQLVEHYYDSEHNTKLNPTYLLHLGMDRPSVNEKFECELATTLNERSKTAVLKLGSCLLHKVHTGYCKGIKALKFDLNQFFYDIHYFLKLSSACREDYKHLEGTANLIAVYALKHSSICWLSMKYVAVRILKQCDNLLAYFIDFLPKQNTFKSTIKTQNVLNKYRQL